MEMLLEFLAKEDEANGHGSHYMMLFIGDFFTLRAFYPNNK